MRHWKLGRGKDFDRSKRLGLLDKVVGLWVRGTVGLSGVRETDIGARFKVDCVYRLICGYRVSVRVGNGFRVSGGFGLWAVGF